MANVKKMMKRGCEFLGTKYSIMGGAMSWISESNLVSAVSNAGGFGVIGSGAMPAEILREEIEKTKAKTDKPFGVNLITLHPQLNELVEVCLDEKVSHVILAGGLPKGETIKALKEGGVKVICFAPALVLAKRLIRNGADALIIEGAEAGGHIGPIATSVLVQEILPNIKDVPVFVAGGIATKEIVEAYLEQGAAGVQVGTIIAASKESIAHNNFKKAYFRANARDAVASSQIDARFPVIPVRAINNKASKDFMEFQKEIIKKCDDGKCEVAEGQLEVEHYWAGALRKAVIDGDIDAGSLMAGQIVGLVKEEKPVAEILAALVD
jgi:enoyl-[acyl-carrier protein] reductase II